MKFKWLRVALVIYLLGAGGCSSISYYSQSIIGHSKLMLARQSIDRAIDNAEQVGNAKLALQLKRAKLIRAFASAELGLPNNKSYSNFAEPQSEFPVYTVVAATEFSLSAKQWCYPVIGCASYRGYFSQQSAQDYALKLQNQSYETSVGGAGAYSTLGWFADPLLPSMLRYGEAYLAEVLFHELAHQRLYINGDSSFNEAFATLVGQEGAKIWLSAHQPELLKQYNQRLSAGRQFNDLLSASKQSLQLLYNDADLSAENVNKLREQKTQLFSQLKTDYRVLSKTQWHGHGWFDDWFSSPVNNARLAAFATYHAKGPLLEELFIDCGRDFDRFYQSLENLKSFENEVNIPAECIL